MIKRLCLFFFCALVIPALGRTVRINLYSDIAVKTAVLKVEKGSYGLFQSGSEVIDIDHRSLVTMSILSGKMVVKANGEAREIQGPFEIRKKLPNSSFRIRVDDDERLYRGSLKVQIIKGKLYLINIAEMDDYVAGVVESEGGHSLSPEYLKAQVVIARTYAFKHLYTHDKKGYDLNDGVDHQAYKSMAYSENAYEVYKAVYITKGEVLVDQSDQFVTAAYHSNSGGYTVNSEDVWSSALPYLRAVEDTFSVGGDHYSWTSELERADWTSYLKNNCPELHPDSIYSYLNFEQEERWVYLPCSGNKIRMKELRAYFRLNSTFFDVATKGNTVYLNGRGFGHGVGLSQEGAMKMSDLGYSYKNILLHYYREARIAELADLQL